jgi:hypothetical protein
MTMNDTEIKTYSDEDTEQIITNRHTGTWMIGTTKGEFRCYLEFHYYNGIKPNWFHRLMARLLLGWKWEDRK